MSLQGSVTLWIKEVKAGNPTNAAAAFREIWERYFQRLARAAQARLQRKPSGAVDGEDVALSAFNHFYDRAMRGDLPDLEGRDDLLEMLMGITAWKARDRLRKEQRQKRGGGRVVGEAALDGPDAVSVEGSGLEQFPGRDPPPELVAMMAEQMDALLSRLDDAEETRLRTIAVLKVEDATNEEIAARLGISLRTVERRLQLIRTAWKKALIQ